MLKSASGKEEVVFRCLTVSSYGEEAFMALPFLKPETTCPCLMQRLCYLVAEDMDMPEKAGAEAPEAGAEDTEEDPDAEGLEPGAGKGGD